MPPNANQETVITPTNTDKPNDPDQPERLEKQGKIKFETQESLSEFMKEHRAHLVVARRLRKLVLIDSFQDIEDARQYISGTDYILYTYLGQ